MALEAVGESEGEGRQEKLWGPSFGLGKHPASQFDEANDVVSKQVAFGTRLPKVSPREDRRFYYSRLLYLSEKNASVDLLASKAQENNGRFSAS